MAKIETFLFDELAGTVESLQSLPEAALASPFATAALAVMACCAYESSPDDCFAMLDFLKGPQKLSVMDKQFLRDRLAGKGYVPRSYFKGTTPLNEYTPEKPFSITVKDNPYSYTNEGYAVLYLHSSGADSDRPITLRQKGDQWFLWQISMLADIRLPRSLDPWQ